MSAPYLDAEWFYGPSKCRAGCPTKDHATWGECARAARIQIDRAALAAGRHDTKEGNA